MTKTRMGDAFLPADEYGRVLPKFSVNLLVRNVARSLSFYCDVLDATVRYTDNDFAAPQIQGTDFMLHADHTYDHHPLHERLQAPGRRGPGTELRVLGVDPDAVEARAKLAGAEILQPATDFPHDWWNVMVVDPDGYTWAVGMPLKRGA